MLERDVEKKVVRYCKQAGILCYKFASPARRGVPDRLLIANGSVLFIELKRPGEKPTTLQYRELDILSRAGVRATWADNTQSAIEIISDHFATDTI